MSRLHLILLFALVCSSQVLGQGKLASYLKYAEEKYNKGDYFYAVELYQKAMELDSNAVTTLWKYAETLKAYKDYRKAEYYYAKVYEREEGNIYPMSLINLGIMQKHNGKYDEALETFKKAKKKFYKDKKNYVYLKAKRELESCLWAKAALKDTANLIFSRLPETVNTKDSEFGHNLQDGKLIFSSLRADSVSSAEEVYATTYKTRLFSAQIKEGQFEQSQRIEDLFKESLNSGNGSYSLDGKRFYFSICQDEGYNYRCKIMVAEYENGKWSNIDSLGDIINEEGSNTTMPSIGKLDGFEVLFFASDRSETEGGMDLWYSVIKNGNQYTKPRNIKTLNSPDNELSPFWDERSKTLYFSSSWHDGFGGQDVFSAFYKEQFEEPKNVGLPLNSAANDIYFFKSGDTSYVTSNRVGVLYSKNPTCCSDIFSGHPPIKILPPTPKETLADLNKRLPVTLYFHNDCPDPKSHDTLTKVNYIIGYGDYREMLDKYQVEYSSGLNGEKAEEAKEDIESFFIEYVDQGVKDLYLFRGLLFEELQKGAKINVTVKGFASPLAKTDYNVNLTKRRISSLVNYLMQYENGVFKPYILGNAPNGGKVVFTQVPFGEYTANKLTSDNLHDQKNSVYSRAAAIERKIEIQSVDYLNEDSLSFITELSPRFVDLAAIKMGQTFSRKVFFYNKSILPMEIDRIEIADDRINVKGPRIVPAVSSIELEFSNKNQLPKGLFSFPVNIHLKGYKNPITIMVNGEGFE
ncbi:MAG: tetratricopeptide repeat protein [Flavobacteriia bacterium]|jgi:tetratricopeptide (TPR) repeat protein